MLGKTKKNLALKITLGLVLALPVGTALAADTATIVDYDALTVKPNAEFIYHGEGDKKADFTATNRQGMRRGDFQLREEIADQVRALQEMKEMAQS